MLCLPFKIMSILFIVLFSDILMWGHRSMDQSNYTALVAPDPSGSNVLYFCCCINTNKVIVFYAGIVSEF